MDPQDAFPCEHNYSIHADVEMISDHISEAEIEEAILLGSRTRNTRGPGHVYCHDTVSVVAKSWPCHHFIITAYKDTSRKGSIKDKPYRRRRHSRRGRKDMRCSRCGKADLRYGSYPLEISGKGLGTFDGYQCPNCLLTFFGEDSSRRIREIIEGLRARPLGPEELSLILLGATGQPIRGAISFMKEMFLLVKEKLPGYDVPSIDPRFIPYHYGPFSFDIIDAWSHLEMDGLIKRTGRASTNKESFELTPEGERTAKALREGLPTALNDELPAWRRGLDELGNDGILKDVYMKYPQFTDKSKIREKVLPKRTRRRA